MPAPKGNKYAVGNNGGAPTKYLKKYAKQAYKLKLLGASMADIAEFFGVGVTTLYTWRDKHKEFAESLVDGGVNADAEVATSLYKRATGFTVNETRVFQYQGDIIKTTVRKYYPPSEAAQKFWLTNRSPENWKNKIEVDPGEGLGSIPVFEFAKKPKENTEETEN